jgi:hypothetical protein
LNLNGYTNPENTNEKLEEDIENEEEDDLAARFEKEYLKKTKVQEESSSFRRIILQNSSPTLNLTHTKLTEAIFALKQVLILSKKNINCNSNLNLKNELSEIYNIYYDKKASYMDSDYNDEPFEKAQPQIKSMPSLIISNYLSLIFCLSLGECWTEVLFYSNEYEKSDYYKKDKDVIYKIDNYKIEALIQLRKIDQALELIKNNMFLVNNNDSAKCQFYNKLNCSVYNEVTYKIALNVNMTKIHFANNNLVEAERCINNIIVSLNNQNNSKDLPAYLINLLIYLNIIKGNVRNALNLIKFHNDETFNQSEVNANSKSISNSQNK